MKRILPLAAVALLLAGGLFYWQSGQSTPLPNVGMAEAQSGDAAEIDKSLVAAMTLGDPDAPVKVVEYASYTCPHCRNFHQNTFDDFKANYIDTGKVHFEYREVYFDRFGLWAGMIARCQPQDAGGAAADAGTDGSDATMTESEGGTAAMAGAAGGPDPATKRYFAITDMIYAQQSEWVQGETPAEIAESLAKIGRQAGLSGADVDACLQNEDLARAMLAVYQENAEADGIRSTPSFLIDGELVTGDKSYGEFSALVDDALE